MANPSIRGHQARFEMYENGSRIGTATATRVSVNQDSNFIRSKFVGNPIPEGDQSQEGWSGTLEMEVKDAVIERFMDALITNNLNGIGVSNYFFVVTELYGDGTRSDYVYSDVQWKLSKDQGSLSDKVTKRLDFQASVRNPV